MKPNKEANKPRITYRYYELPEGELVQAITGEDWVCTYGTYAEDVHFHNVMEIGICRWGRVSWFWKISASTIPMVQLQWFPQTVCTQL